jgi:hypothetical protein
MLPLALDFLVCDPLPVAPNVPRDSATFWRWYSLITLQARAEAA